MGRSHQKLIGFHKNIIENTSISRINNNIMINSIDTKMKPINYIIPKELFEEYTNSIIEIMIISGEIHLNDAIEMLFSKIYKIYKTKVATIRIPLLILNVLVREGICYSDDCEDYLLKVDEIEFENWINKL